MCPNVGHRGLYPTPTHRGSSEWGKTTGKAWGALTICALPGASQVDPGTKQGGLLGPAAALGAVAIASAATAVANRDMLQLVLVRTITVPARCHPGMVTRHGRLGA